MRKILLVEDDQSLGESLSERLQQDFQVTWASNFQKALKYMPEIIQFDLAILDVGLPDGNGFDLAKKIKENSQVPIIFLTAQADAENRLKGYEMGAEEYIPKPFHLKELLLRVHHVMSEHPSVNRLDVGESELRLSEFLVVRKKTGEKIVLSATEMKVLEILVKKSPNVVNRDDLMNEVWGLDRDLSHRTIDNMVAKLRTALGNDGQKIKAVRGVGYQFKE